MKLPGWIWRAVRSRRTKIALACAPFALCALVALAYPVAGWLGRWQVKRHLAGLERAGHVVDPENYYIPSDNSDDDVFQHPAMVRERDDPELGGVFHREPGIPGLSRRRPRTEYRLAEGSDLTLWFDPPETNDKTAAERLLTELDGSILRANQLRPALARPEAAWPLAYSTDFLTELREVPNVISGQFLLKRLLQFHADLAVIHLAGGDSRSAADGVTSMLEIFRHYLDSRPNMTSLLLADGTLRASEGILWEGVRREMWTPDQLADIDKRLAVLDPQRSAGLCYRGEIAFSRWKAEQLLAAPDELGAKGELEWKEGWEWDRERIAGRSRALWRQLRPLGLDLMKAVKVDQIVLRHAVGSEGSPRAPYTAADMAWFRQRKEACPKAIFAGHSGWSTQQRDIDASAWHALENLATSALSMEARIALIRGGLALEKYRLLEGGHPADLADLVPNFIDALPSDPFDGQALRYRRQADGSPQLWSIGPDLRDEGGLPHQDRAQGDMVWITRPIPGFTKSDLRR